MKTNVTHKLISNMKDLEDAAPGYNDILMKVLKSVATVIALILLHFFQLLFH